MCSQKMWPVLHVSRRPPYIDATYKISLNPLSNLCLNVGFVGNVVARPIGIYISYNLIVISITVFFC